MMQRETINNTNAMVTPAAYAESRGLNRSTICRQIRAGKIPTHNGFVKPSEADRARRENLSEPRGGGRRKQKADREPINFQEDFWVGALAQMNQLRSPEKCGVIAELAIAYGCSAWQAWALATVWHVMIALWGVPEEYHDTDGLIRRFEREPDWAKIANLAGEPLDLKTWKKTARRRVRAFEASHPEW
jgi:hypothetical protein